MSSRLARRLSLVAFLVGLVRALVALAIAGPVSAAQTVEAVVPRVADGDSLWAEDARGTKMGVRLLGIDAPEKSHRRKGGGSTPGQPWGDQAQQTLAKMVFEETVQVEVYGRDRYGRILGVLYHGGTNINLWLVRSGLAWYYRGGRNDAPPPLQNELEAAEQEALSARRGLWADPNPEPPWTFRQRMRLAGD